ncbi:MAG TPA: NDP-sugar synthase [Pyrinomonadaceae bacterium]|nr:NDP-sugar synthase [Pyrinomonadaceae bacterium]
MRAIVLSAGYGTRLWPLTEDRTKPAIPILGKPLVGYVAEYLARHGIDEIVVNLHHRPESVRRALGDGSRFGVKLHYVEEPVILGTSGAIDNTREFFERETFVAVNGKIITDIDLSAALQTHRNMKAIATLVLLPNTLRERFTVVETEHGLLKGFGGMPSNQHGSAPLMFTGIQILEPRIFEYIPRGVFSHTTTDVYPQAMARGEVVAAHVASGKWRELSTLPRYLDISVELLHEQGMRYVAGANTTIAGTAAVNDSILWDSVEVSAGAKVNRAILADNVKIPSGETVENAVVVPANLVQGKVPPDKALPGHLRGENFIVPL